MWERDLKFGLRDGVKFCLAVMLLVVSACGQQSESPTNSTAENSPPLDAAAPSQPNVPPVDLVAQKRPPDEVAPMNNY